MAKNKWPYGHNPKPPFWKRLLYWWHCGCPICGAELEWHDMSMNWDLPGAYGYCKEHGHVSTA